MSVFNIVYFWFYILGERVGRRGRTGVESLLGRWVRDQSRRNQRRNQGRNRRRRGEKICSNVRVRVGEDGQEYEEECVWECREEQFDAGGNAEVGAR
jgi:hypothetical protein